ncbi:TIP41-like family-domain-containing protein [Biscogniauxia sp. FL1348]|nr:TIP41-like family-domain-containing protein [Biscogniauxia sp. FL1348]
MATTVRPPAHITSPNEPFPTPTDIAQATTTHRQGAFTISSRKLPISKAGPIEAMERSLGIPVPEMIFGDNLVRVEHAPSGWAIEFSARDALDAVDKTDRHMLQVAYARSWSASREQTSAGIREVVRPFDWSYSTTYRGTVTTPPSGKEGAWGQFGPSDRPIPIELLKRRDPILFFDEVMLYESELDDNGISLLSAKVRVHERRMLLLCRLYMRLDNVVVRIRDTRIYIDFDAEEVTREYTVKEAPFGDVKQKLLMTGLRPDGVTVALRDANQIAELLPTLEQTLESVSLKS